MKNIAGKLGGAVIVIIFLGLIIDTGSVIPPDNALVYLNPTKTVYFPPTRTPANAGFIPVSYSTVKRIGAKPDNPQGFNIDGPPLLIVFLESAGIVPEWPSYWLGTNTPVKTVNDLPKPNKM